MGVLGCVWVLLGLWGQGTAGPTQLWGHVRAGRDKDGPRWVPQLFFLGSSCLPCIASKELSNL